MSADIRMVSIPLDMIRLLPDRGVGEFVMLAFAAKGCQGDGEQLRAAERVGKWARLLTANQFAALVEALDVGRQATEEPRGQPARKPALPPDSAPEMREGGREVVLESLSKGPLRAESIRTVTNLSEGQVKGLLKRLIEQGAVTTTGRGRGVLYALARSDSSNTDTSQEGTTT